MRPITLTIEPSDKYRRVIGAYNDTDTPDTEYDDWPDDHQDAANAYIETVEQAPTAEDLDMDPNDMSVLQWSDISVSSDPDLVKRMATYLDGLKPEEPTAELRAKLRLLDVDTYATIQLAAREELHTQ